MSIRPICSRFPIGLRLWAFGVLERLFAWRQRGVPVVSPVSAPGHAASPRSLWVFVSAIGELNAIEPFLRSLLAEWGQPPLTLISDRAHYTEAYLAQYPHAAVEVIDGSQRQVRDLVTRRPPLLLLVAEIPGLLQDAPCRFSFATMHAARQAGAATVLVNGWLYGYAPPSRMDSIERHMFGRDYLLAFDLLMVQTEAVRQTMLAMGAQPQRVCVTGNIKFDAMQRVPSVPPSAGALTAELLAYSEGPIVVAGSAATVETQRHAVSAFKLMLKQIPGARLVLAPRHPENAAQMAELVALLESAVLPYQLRSKAQPGELLDAPVMVLDTIGELRSVYQAATVAYVGTDHNVLEPLTFGKPVFVTEGWEPTYPSYAVYRQLLDARVLRSASTATGLGEAWLTFLSEAASCQAGSEAERISALLKSASGATERCLELMREWGLTRARADALTAVSAAH